MELILNRIDDGQLITRNCKTELISKLLNDFVTLKTVPDNIADLAAGQGILGLVKLLNIYDVKVTQNGINLAAGKGHMEMVKYLMKKGLKVDPDGISMVAGKGQIS